MKIGPDFHRYYEERCGVLEDLGPVIERLIQELLRANQIEAHSVRHRIKTKESLKRKVGRKDASYEGLDEVHDLLGIRVITFFPDEVDRVAGVINAEFQIDPKNSVDKRALLDPDRFGYLSLHYVASLNQRRAKLTEHTRFDGWKFEIQIRSILQHAWAEIEHDLGYHTAGAIPDSFRRRFSRLAGLLEIADDEFETLRDEVANYQSAVSKDVSKSPESVPIDQDSIAALVMRDHLIAELDSYIASAFGLSLEKGFPGAGAAASRLGWAGFKLIADVADAVKEREELIRKFVDRWSQEHVPTGQAYQGIALFYLTYVVLSETEDADKIVVYLNAHEIGPEAARASVAREVIDTYVAAKAEVMAS
jgi:ppGpp synthetase/RelA/SpoT-type nucleotidyltranferase